MKHFLSLGCVCVILASASAQTDEAKKVEFAPPPASDIRSLEVFPPSLTLNGQDDSAQLVITGKMASRDQDLTGNVTYAVADPKVAKITPHGRIIPLTDGKTEIVAKYGDKVDEDRPRQRLHMTENLPINFANQVVPVFTKLGCNSGGCHGKSGGQNGFALSLLGFVPEFDYQTLVKENRGRRLFPANPDQAACSSRRPPASGLPAAASEWTSAPTSTSSSAAGSPRALHSARRRIPRWSRTPSSRRVGVLSRNSVAAVLGYRPTIPMVPRST